MSEQVEHEPRSVRVTVCLTPTEYHWWLRVVGTQYAFSARARELMLEEAAVVEAGKQLCGGGTATTGG